MKGKKMSKRILSLILVLTMLVAYAVPTHAAVANNVRVEKISGEGSLVSKQNHAADWEKAPEYDSTDVVRVSIILDGKSTIEQGYATKDIANNAAAMKYSAKLATQQGLVTQKISKALGKDLDVVWNLTLVANIISANVEYGQIEKIKAVPGVKNVVLEVLYEPTSAIAGDKPNMEISTGMTSATAAWQAGYTGAGSRIAIIDTGLDVNHQSFNNDAFKHALEEDAAKAGKSYDAYIADKDLLDKQEIAGVLSKLHAAERYSGLSADSLFLTEKIPFAFNYVDRNLNVSHLRDTASEHGSHVAGIASANRYLSDGKGGFVDALESVHVAGAAPDAQMLVMKVFGENGGAYDSDYVVAIEDAIMLGCDSVNLSLGSGMAGFTTSVDYQSIFDSLEKTDTVVVISAGNNYAFGQQTQIRDGYLYSDDVNFHTGGSPGTYANAFTVASVENQGHYGNYFEVAGVKYLFSETSGYGNAPIATLAGDQDSVTLDYVLVDGFGVEEDYAGINLTGKVVLCSRGNTSFFEKANVAAKLGAAAVAIYNNAPGVINLNLTGYEYTAPVISIMQSDGAAIKAASTEQTSSEGKTYYTGKITVNKNAAMVHQPSEYFTMSDFSSWGVPGDLTLKPEIAAPGGDIYSVNGSTGSTGGIDQYELMSGTSMAAPQITGLTAILKQYIEENGLSQSGMTDRALAQSLLMSTAVPMMGSDAYGAYIISLLQQGAGLANITNAFSAGSYVLVNGTADGKVKAELGDDPGKTGKYSFTFTLNNLLSEELTYTLDADVFTQGFLQDSSGNICLDRVTAMLGATVTFTVDGKTLLIPGTLNAYDFDGDGDTDKADAQLLMDSMIKGAELIANQDHTDVDGDGDTDTYDVYTLLEMLECGYNVTVPANGSAEVTVNISLNAGEKAALNELAPNGAYVEAYIYANALPGADGAQTASHSIPVLGFYGNWSDASMYDKGTLTDWLYDKETRTPYFANENNILGNALYVNYALDGLIPYAGNPYTMDSAYLEERNALNNQVGDTISMLSYALIRNAGGGCVTITNAETGETYYSLDIGELSDTYRIAGFLKSTNADPYANAYTFHELDIGWAGTDASGNPLPEGTKVKVALTMAPEYYVGSDGKVDYEALGEGATMSMQFTIDNTMPELVGGKDGSDVAHYDSGVLSFQAKDNRHIAYVALGTLDGQLIKDFIPDQTEAGKVCDIALDSALADGVYLMEMYDYAGNGAIYRIFVNEQETSSVESVSVAPANMKLFTGNSAQLSADVQPLTLSDLSVVWTSSDPTVATVDENGLVTAVNAGECDIIAASAMDQKVTGACHVTVVTLDYTLNGVLQDAEGNPMTYTWDMLNNRTWSKVADMKPTVGSAALAGNGNYYVMDTVENSWAVHEVNPTTGETVTSGTNGAIPYWDMATSKVFAGANNSDVIHGIYGYYVFPSKNPMAPDGYGYNLTSWLQKYTGGSLFVGVESAGYNFDQSLVDEGLSGHAELLWALDNAGYVWMFELPLEGGLYLINFYPTNLNVEYSLQGDYTQCSLVEANDGSALFFSHFDGTTNVMYMLEPVKTADGIMFNATRVGDVGKDVWPAALISVIRNAAADVSLFADEDSGVSIKERGDLPLEFVSELTLCQKDEVISDSEENDQPKGGLNARDDAIAAPASSGDVTEEQTGKNLIVNVTAQDANGDVASTNGKFTVSYDPNALTLVSVLGSSEIVSYTDVNGIITFGYAGLNTIAAGEKAATLVFEVKDIANSGVTVTNQEVNNDHVEASEEITHNFTDVVTPATCTEKGYTTHTCTDPECGYTFIDSYVDPLGHDYEDVVTPPTANQKGYTTHTCKRCGDSYVDSYVDALGYSFTDDSKDQTITVGSSLKAATNGSAADVVGVYVNGVLVDAKYYTISGENAEIVLSKEYLANLSVGTYTLRVEFKDGAAETSFTIKADSGNVHTGDTFNAPVMLLLLAVSAAGACALVVNRKKFLFR